MALRMNAVLPCGFINIMPAMLLIVSSLDLCVDLSVKCICDFKL